MELFPPWMTLSRKENIMKGLLDCGGALIEEEPTVESETIINSYLNSLITDFDETLSPDFEPEQRSLIMNFIMNHIF